MATPGDGSAPYENAGAGGKFRKRPFRRTTPATPYVRPPTAVRNNNPSILKKLVDPASRLISAGAHRLFDVFRKSLPPLSLGPPVINKEAQNVVHKEGGNVNVSAASGISELELMLQQKSFTRSEIQRLTSLLHSKTTESEKHGDNRDAAIAVTSKVTANASSPAELAKYYMESRPTDSKLLQRTPKNGLVTPRSRGRSAMYTMARTPYSSTSPSTFTQQALKRSRRSVLDEDIGSLRRIRQKANLLTQRDKKELGHPVFEADENLVLTNEPESKYVDAKSVDKPIGMRESNKLRLDMLHGQALKSLEKVDSPPINGSHYYYDIQKPESSLRSKDKTEEEEENQKFPLSNSMVNGNGGDSLKKGTSPITDLPSEEKEPQKKKHAFQMSAPEDTFEMDEDDGPVLLENNKSASDIIIKTPSTLVEVEVEVSTTRECSILPESDDDISPKTDSVIEQGVSSSPLIITTSEIPEPVNKVVSPNANANEIESTRSALNLVTKNDHQHDAVEEDKSKKTSSSSMLGGKSEESVAVAVSTNGIFSFGSNTPLAAPFPSSTTTTTAATASPQAFSFGSLTAPTTSVAETATTTGTGLFGFTSSAATSTTTTASGVSSSAPATTTSGLFSFSAPAAATSTTTTANGLFGVSSSAVATTTTTGTALFGFSSLAPATSTTTSSGLFGVSSSATATTSTSGLFGFSAPAAAATSTTTTANGFSSSAAAATTTSGLIGVSSSAPATTTASGISSSAAATSSSSGLFGFSAPAVTTSASTANGVFGFSSTTAAISSTTTSGPSSSQAATSANGVFGFSSPAPAAATSTTTGSSLFGFSSPAAAASTCQSQGSFFNGSSSSSSSSSLFGSTVPAFGSSSSFGVGPTTSVFGSTWQKSSGGGFGAPPISSFATGGGASVFGNSTPSVFGANNNNNNNDQMSMEDTMAEDSMQTQSPPHPFGAVTPTPGFMFGGATPTPTAAAAVPFSFGGVTQTPNPFQSSSVEFNNAGAGGSFSLGSGGEKSNRRIVRVMKSKNRKKP